MNGAGLFQDDPAVPELVHGQVAIVLELPAVTFAMTWLRAENSQVMEICHGLDAARMWKPNDKSWCWHYSPHSPILGHWYRDVAGIREYIFCKRQGAVE